MIENVNVLKAIFGKSLFVVGFFDPQRKGQKGYLRTTKYGTETKMRVFLKLCGVSALEIDRLFAAANL